MAEMLAAAFSSVNRNDLQIVVPVRPLVRRGIRVRPVSEGAVVDGALVTRKLRGDFAKNQLPLMMAPIPMRRSRPRSGSRRSRPTVRSPCCGRLA